MASPNRGGTFAALNRRYARTSDGSTIRYDGPSHVLIRFDVTMSSAQEIADFIDFHGRRRRATAKETIILRLIAGVSHHCCVALPMTRPTTKTPQSLAANHQPRPRCGISDQLGTGVLTHQLDVDICDTLDTLTALEDAAEDMGIPGYTRILMKKFMSEPCECRSCIPPPKYLAWLLRCAQKSHAELRPEVFERILGGLREDAASS